MSRPDVEPLAPELERLLEAERSRPDPPPEMRSRVLEQIGNELLDQGMPSAPSGASDGGNAGNGAAPSGTASLLRRVPLAVSLLALGGLGGAGLHAVLSEPARTTIYVPVAAVAAAETPAAAPAPAEMPAEIAAPAEPPTPGASKGVPRHAGAPRLLPSAPSAPAAPVPADRDSQLARDAALAAERALLEQARTALARGKPGAALAVLARHQHDFPGGQLVEEREALEILCLAADRQTETARARAAAFRQAHPRSMLLRAVDAALAAGS